MSYGNTYNGNYGNYGYSPNSFYGGYPYPAQPQPQVQPQPQNSSVVNTNKLYATGIEDVRCRPIPVNSDYIFLDNDKPLIYRKTTDGTGKMDIQVFKITPYQEEEIPAVDMSQYVLKTDFEALREEITSLKKSLKPESQKSIPKKTI